MDAEDLGEFGIAPQRIQTHKDFAPSSEENRLKRKQVSHTGPIPGVPVLEQLIAPLHDKVAVRMLKSMGWRPGQGVGPRQTRKQKKRASKHNQREIYLMQQYGFQPNKKKNNNDDDNDQEEDSEDDDDDEITFAPDDYDPFVVSGKENRFGLGYSGLNRDSVLGGSDTHHFTLFEPLEMLDKTQHKKFTISGQAFGVGALEEEDDDIYARDDLTKYDFSLDEKKSRQAKKTKSLAQAQDPHVVEGFTAAKQGTQYIPPQRVDLPFAWKPRHWGERKSRFSPLDIEKARLMEEEQNRKKAALGRHDMTPRQRGQALGESAEEKDVAVAPKPTLQQMQETYKKRAEQTQQLLERISAKANNFQRGGLIDTKGEEQPLVPEETPQQVELAVQQERQELIEKCSNKMKALGTTKTPIGNFKPFLQDEAKQLRYEQFLTTQLHEEAKISEYLNTIQPVHLSAWDREMEMKEFIQARNIYKPLEGLMFDRFVTETELKSASKTVKAQSAEVTATEKTDSFERTRIMWKPCALLCKRYNIAEPFVEKADETQHKQSLKSKLSIFDYMEISVNNKANFQTPVIIPKHIQQAKPLIQQTPIAAIAVEQKQSVATQAEQHQTLNTAQSSSKFEIPSSSVKTPRATPKTELEKRVEETKDLPPSEKLDLFKLIFDSDGEGEGEGEIAAVVETEAEHPVTAAEENIHRNNSPPRGIFAALFLNQNLEKPTLPLTATSSVPVAEESKDTMPSKTLNKVTFTPKSARAVHQDNPVAEVYGPALPAHIDNKALEKQSHDELFLKPLPPPYKPNNTWVDSSVLLRYLGSSGSSEDPSEDSTDSSDDESSKKTRKKKAHKSGSERKKKKKKYKAKDKKKPPKRRVKKYSHKSKKSKTKS